MHAAAAAMAAAVVNAAVDDMLGGEDAELDPAIPVALNATTTTTTRADAAAAALAGELDALVGGLDVAETWSAVRAPHHRHAVAAALVVSGALLVVAGYRLLSFCTAPPHGHPPLGLARRILLTRSALHRIGDGTRALCARLFRSGAHLLLRSAVGAPPRRLLWTGHRDGCVPTPSRCPLARCCPHPVRPRRIRHFAN